MPKIVRSTWRYSAWASGGSISATTMISLFTNLSSMSMVTAKQEIADVDGEAQALMRINRRNVAKNGKLHAAFDSEALVDAQSGRPQKKLLTGGAGHDETCSFG